MSAETPTECEACVKSIRDNFQSETREATIVGDNFEPDLMTSHHALIAAKDAEIERLRAALLWLNEHPSGHEIIQEEFERTCRVIREAVKARRALEGK